MFTVKRISTEPSQPIQIVAHDGDRVSGLYFFPAGSSDGPTVHQTSEAVTAAIMSDPGLVGHFDCDPAWPVVAAKGPVVAEDGVDATDGRRAKK